MDKAIQELVNELESQLRRCQKRLIEYEFAQQDLERKIEYLESKLEKIKKDGGQRC